MSMREIKRREACSRAEGDAAPRIGNRTRSAQIETSRDLRPVASAPKRPMTSRLIYGSSGGRRSTIPRAVIDSARGRSCRKSRRVGSPRGESGTAPSLKRLRRRESMINCTPVIRGFHATLGPFRATSAMDTATRKNRFNPNLVEA